MKRLHIHIGVENLQQSVRFYNALFGAEPVKTKTDYAKWLLDDPRVNFAISTRAGSKGVDHLGVQVEQDSELDELRQRFAKADLAVFDEGETECCYARSDKSWVQDPSGIAWEAYKTMEDVQYYAAADRAEGKDAAASTACCVPQSAAADVAGTAAAEPAKACCN